MAISGAKHTVVSTFAGCGGSSLGYQWAGFKELLAIDFDKNAHETFKMNFDCPAWLRDIKTVTAKEIMDFCKIKEGELDVLDGSPPCFPKGTSIITNQCEIPIDFLTSNMIILTHKNQFRKVKQVHKREYLGNLINIGMKYGRKDISCTPQHQFYARQRIFKTRDCKNKKNGSKYKTYTESKWIKAQDLNIGDVVLEPHIIESLPLEIPKIIKKQRINKKGQSGNDLSDMQLFESECCINWKINDMAWILGFYLAEGHLRGHNPTLEINKPCRREVIFSVNEKEALSIVDKLQALNLNSCIQKHGQGSCRVTVSSIDFWALCSVVGKYADGKFIPTAFHSMPIEWQKEFIDGYFSGDGCFLKNGKGNSIKRKATTVSWGIVQGMTKMIAKVFGIVASIEVLYFAGKSVIMGRNVTVKDTYSISFVLDTSSRIRPGFVDEFGQWIPIKMMSSVKSDNPINVYNLEVDEDQSYTANGYAVHNCQGFSTAGKRQVFDDRNDLFKEYVRLIEGLKPKVFVMENVSGMIKGTMKGKFKEILLTLKALPYQVKCKLMNAKYYQVPQSRERLIFIGVRNDLGIEPSFPVPGKKLISLKQICPDALASKSQQINSWTSSKKPIITIQKSSFLKKIIKIKNGEREPSLDELKIFGTFPKEFNFINKSSAWNRIGNSVSPKFMQAIAENIKINILDKYYVRA